MFAVIINMKLMNKVYLFILETFLNKLNNKDVATLLLRYGQRYFISNELM